MERIMYDLNSLTIQEKEELFHKDPKNYLYSVFHEMIDKAFVIIDEYSGASEIEENIYKVIPFEVLTQLLNFLTNVFSIEEVFQELKVIEQEFRNNSVTKFYQ